MFSGFFHGTLEDIPPANPPTEVVLILAPEILPAMTREQLIHEQQNDVELSAFAAKAVSETEASKVGVCYYVLSGLLMLFLGMAGFYRKFCCNFTVVAPLTDLLTKGTLCVLQNDCYPSGIVYSCACILLVCIIVHSLSPHCLRKLKNCRVCLEIV